METLQRTANRGSISTGYDIENSLKFESDNSETMYKSITNGNQQKWTTSIWFKRTEVDVTSGYRQHLILHNSKTHSVRISFGTTTYRDQLWVQTTDGTSLYEKITKMKFRDTSAWYHIVWRVDTTQATATDRVRIYVNGNLISDYEGGTTEPPQNTNLIANYNVTSGINQVWFSDYDPSGFFNGYIAEVNHVDGQSLAPTDFGEFDADTGIWKPIAYTGSYGNNGFYLDFEDSASLGADDSGNGNNFTLNNITSADQATDTPTNSFTTFNDKCFYINTQVYAEAIVRKGNTSWETTRASWWRTGISINGVSNGKWYAEFTANTSIFMVGVGSYDKIDYTTNQGLNTHLGATYTGAIGYYGQNGNIYDSSTNYSWGSTFTSGDIISIALDRDNGYVYFAKNGTWQNSGDPTSGSSGTGGVSLTYPSDAYYMGVSFFDSNICLANWGGYTDISIASGNADANDYGNFEYAPPSGYYAWCTKNLAEFG